MEWDLNGLLVLIPVFMATGVAAGLIAGLLGVGGGIVVVPVLYQVFTWMGFDESVKMHVAVGTSLATILATGYSSARAHHQKGSVDIELLKKWWLPILVGVTAGAALAAHLSGEALTLFFAIVVLLVAVNMLAGDQSFTVSEHLPPNPLLMLYGFIIGKISVMMGIGGGTLSVPIMRLYAFPIRRAVGTASAIGLLIAIPGTLLAAWFGWGIKGLPPGSVGYVNLVGFLLIIPMSTLAAPWGARIAHSVPPHYLQRFFAGFLIITGIRMLWSAL